MSQRRFERAAQRRQAAAERRRDVIRRRRAGLAAGAVGAAVLIAPSAAGAATFTVDQAGDAAPAGACDPGIAADCTLRDAVNQANSSPDPDTIAFAAGLPTIELTEGELILDTDEGDITVAGPGASALTISGTDNSRIFDVVGGGVAEISGLTLIDGKTTESGGAIRSHSELTVSGTVVKDSSAASDGGGIASFAPLDVVSSTVVDNDSGNAGGGISQRSEPALDKFDTRGLGEDCEELPYPLDLLCEFGFGIDTTDPGDLTVEDSSVSRNVSGQGGGIYADYASYKGEQPLGDVSITRTTVDANTAESGGGGIGLGTFTSENTFDLVDSTVSRNRVEVEEVGEEEESLDTEELLRRARAGEPLTVPNGTGGGIEFGVFAGVAKVSNSTVSGNSAAQGGGIHAGGQQVPVVILGVSSRDEVEEELPPTAIEVANTTVATNDASRTGGGVSLGENATPGSNVKLTSTIVGANTAPAEPDLETQTESPGFDATHSLIQNLPTIPVNADATKPNVTGQGPNLGGLTNNGGPTETHLPAEASPAIDQGSNEDGLENDQRQAPRNRVVDLSPPNATGGDGTDIGAVEIAKPTPATTPGITPGNSAGPLTPSSAPSICGRRAISLVRADRRGSKVRLSGLVGAALYGKTVTIQTDPKGVRAGAFKKTTTVKASPTGAFTATVPAPDRADYVTVRYRAKAGRSTSPALKLPQSLSSRSVKSSKGTITVTGRVRKAVLGKRNRVKIRRLVCGRYRTVGSAKPDAEGKYRITFRATEIRGVSLYRAEARVLRKAGSKVYVTQYARAIAIKTTSQTG